MFLEHPENEAHTEFIINTTNIKVENDPERAAFAWK